MSTWQVVMFDFFDKKTSEYKNYSTFVDDISHRPIEINLIEKNAFPYPFVEELEPQKIFKKENLLSEDECEYLVWLAETSDYWPVGSMIFWEERNIPFLTKLQSHKHASSELREICFNIHDRIKNFISESFGVDVFADQIGIVRWPPSSYQMTHIDAIQGFDRIAGCVVFLNDDYDGGEPFYPYYGLITKPKRGMIYAHDPGHSHLHGVTRIRNKTRYTISSTWTRKQEQSKYAQFVGIPWSRPSGV